MPKRFFDRSLPYALTFPALVLVIIFKLYPILNTIIDSFFYRTEISFKNYFILFTDPLFLTSLWVTVKYTLWTTPLQLILAIIMALLIKGQSRRTEVFRTIFYLPVTISLAVATMIWGLMLDPNNGIINSILMSIGIGRQGFLVDKAQALGSIVLIVCWKSVGYWMMFILAGLKNIEQDVYEAAEIDGANIFTTFFRITLPLIKRQILFVVVSTTTINMLQFAPMHIITKGGPQMSTNTLMYEVFKSTFMYVDKGRASAIVAVLLAMIASVAFVQFSMMGDRSQKDKKAVQS